MAKQVRLSGGARKIAILAAVRPLLAEKGIKGTTSRELAEVAGISEALLFRHFPSKEDLYAETQADSLANETRLSALLEAMPDSAETLYIMLWRFLIDILDPTPFPERAAFNRLIFTSLMEGGDFAREAFRGGPMQVNRKIWACLQAAAVAGEAQPQPLASGLAGWLPNHLGLMLLLTLGTQPPAVDYQVPRADIPRQALWFCLRGLGLKDSVIQRLSESVPEPPDFHFPPLSKPS